MSRPRLLDLFAGGQGAGVGYARAGFEVHAVDIVPHDKHPEIASLTVADAFAVLADVEFCRTFDVIHASPPCQVFARVTRWRGDADKHPDLLTPTLAALPAIGVPAIVENVPEAAPIRADYLLCGTQFGLRVRRHRAFQRIGWDAYTLMPPCHCYRNRTLLPFVHKGERAFADALGCTWMSNLDARQAIPPRFTTFIGAQLLEALERAA